MITAMCRKFAAFAGFSVLAFAAQADDRVSPRDFAKLAAYTSAAISPDGEHLALSVPAESEQGIVVIQLSDMEVVGTAKPSNGSNERFEDITWIGNEYLVSEIVQAEGSLDRPAAFGEYISMKYDGSDRRYFLGHRTDNERIAGSSSQALGSFSLISALLDEPEKALFSFMPWRGEYDKNLASVVSADVRNSRTSRRALAPARGFADFVADEDGDVRFAVVYDEQSLLMRTYLRRGDDDWKEISSVKDELEILPLRLSSDGEKAYLAKSRDSRSCLWEMSMSSGDMQALACDEVADLSNVYFDPRSNEPLAAYFDAGVPSPQWLQPESPLAQAADGVAAAFPNQVAMPISQSRDGSRIVFFVYSDKNPGAYYLFDRRANKLRFIVATRPWIEADDMGPRYPVRWTAQDGTTIHGYLTVPPGAKASNLPLIVIPHGGPYGVRDDWRWEADAQLFAQYGYAVLQPNFRGSSGYGAEYEEAARLKTGTMMIDDITAGVRWAIDKGMVDEERICIYGGSYGGYATLMSAVREPDLYQCAIGYVGVYDVPLQKRWSDTSRTEGGRNFLERYWSDDPAQSPINFVKQLKAPFFIVHGEADERVPINQAQALRSALQRAGHPYEYMTKRGEGHGFWDEDNRTELYERMLAFVGKHIGPGGADGDD